MILPFATQNEGKLQEARQVLQPYGIRVQSLSLDLVEPDLGTIEDVTKEKMNQVQSLGYQRVMVDDAGIFFKAYNRFPGILSKRVFQGIGYRGVMKLLDGESRDAWFEGAVAVLWDGKRAVFSDRTPGRIVNTIPSNIDPEPGFPFNPIFIPNGDHRTLAEMSPQERQQYSYRGKVLKKVADWITR
ncbi:non-canonical purine NTP pyrophosphatase [Melghirimyces algeriensis]|uniref:DITPase n=1 Tax=Melghirimyces algeriensis TaxID=910412 RepID=A0A521D121_9BACL|nr:non-canonical purine NTP pyrophosphatase [Melghirimyces algeriensis]SMO65405.1 dITPase [Melghirimyces algeriensis]